MTESPGTNVQELEDGELETPACSQCRGLKEEQWRETPGKGPDSRMVTPD